MKEQKVRDIDRLAQEVHSWWGKTFVFVRKTQVKTWQGVFILAFISGLVAAIIWSVSLDIQQSSDAVAGKASLKIRPDNYVALLGEVFDVDVFLDTNANNIVVAKATLVYNSQDFELQKWDTSQSVFSQNNACALEGKPCEIVYDDKSAGKITFILTKPTPGVKTASGMVARLTFKALREVTTGDQNFKLNFVSEGSYADSDAILDDGKGTDILGSVGNSTITAIASVCSEFTYSEWGGCQPDGTQTRAMLSDFPAGCKGGNPVLLKSCGRPEDKEPKTCAHFQYSEWGACDTSNTQSRIIISSAPPECVGGDPVLTQSCQYSAPVCAEFTYSDWGMCRSNSKQSRTVVSSLPAGCQGGSSLLEQLCVFKSVLDRSITVGASSKKPKSKAAITQSGSGFSADGQVTVYMYRKKKSRRIFLPSQTATVDAQGSFSLALQAPASKGKYYWYVIDENTGKRSKLSRLRVR